MTPPTRGCAACWRRCATRAGSPPRPRASRRCRCVARGRRGRARACARALDHARQRAPADAHPHALTRRAPQGIPELQQLLAYTAADVAAYAAGSAALGPEPLGALEASAHQLDAAVMADGRSLIGQLAPQLRLCLAAEVATGLLCPGCAPQKLPQRARRKSSRNARRKSSRSARGRAPARPCPRVPA